VSALADHFMGRRAEAARWGACFAAVVVAHGLGLMVLLNNATEASSFGVDIPVVMLDLPESLSTILAPRRDLAPGPLEEESQPTPPPPEETKRPEPQAELALPMPEPPKPEPPTEEKQATAPPESYARRAVARWQSTLASHLERNKRYPAEARSRRQQGTARVAFTIDHEGRLVTSQIVQSSGSPALDEEALAMLRRAQPMPRPPAIVQERDLEIDVPVNFGLK
jgi:protein TonB